MADTNVLSDTPPSYRQDNATLAHLSGDYGDHRRAARGDDGRLDVKGAKITSVDSSPQGSPSESTPLLAPPIPHIQECVAFELNGGNTMSVIWEEAKILSRYTLPVLGTCIFEQSTFVTSVIFIGHISTTALAAGSIGLMTASVTGFCTIQGMTSTLDTILPSAWTSGQPQLVGLWTQRMVVLQLVALIPICAIWLNGEAILLMLRQDTEVARYAGIYLKSASFGLPAYSFNCISRRYFQAQARIIICIAPINILLSYLLVWGPDSIRLGFIGAPIAISISNNLMSIASVVYGMFFVEKTAWHPISTRCFTSLGTLAWLCVGSVGQLASEWWSWELVGLAASFLGTVSLASQSVLITTTASAFQPPFALAIATSVRIGNLLGEKKAKRARIAAYTGLLLAVALCLFLSSLLLTFRNTWGYLFNSDQEVVALVAAILPLVALVHIPDGCGSVISGILRAQGKQSLGAIINISAFVLLGGTFGLWLTFERQYGLYGLWWGLTIGMTTAASLGLYLCLSADWEQEVEKAMARLEADKAYLQVIGA